MADQRVLISGGGPVGLLCAWLLGRRGLPVKGAARANVPGTDQRHNMISASTVDLDEAYRVGQKAAHLAQWRRHLARAWQSIRVEAVEANGADPMHVGSQLQVRARIAITSARSPTCT